jgi:hypothetical protein
MLSRASQIVAAFALLICFVCPLVELFDYWDDSVITGNDTEYGLVVLALCAGAAYTLARLVFQGWTIFDFLSRSILAPGIETPSCFTPVYFRLPFFEYMSPPELPLRI